MKEDSSKVEFTAMSDDELSRELRLLAAAGKGYTLKIRDRALLQEAGDRLRKVVKK